MAEPLPSDAVLAGALPEMHYFFGTGAAVYRGIFGSLTEDSSGGTRETFDGLDVLLNRSGTIAGVSGFSFVSGRMTLAILKFVHNCATRTFMLISV